MISSATILLQLALALLMSVQSNSVTLSATIQQQAITVAHQAIQISSQILGINTEIPSQIVPVAPNTSVSQTFLTPPAPTVSAPQVSTNLNISGLNPSSGPVGTTVTILGTGFTTTNNTIEFHSGSANSSLFTNISSPDGRSLQFTVPINANATTASCMSLGGGPCVFPTTVGAYSVSVTNANGDSNTVSFTVIASSTSAQ